MKSKYEIEKDLTAGSKNSMLDQSAVI